MGPRGSPVTTYNQWKAQVANKRLPPGWVERRCRLAIGVHTLYGSEDDKSQVNPTLICTACAYEAKDDPPHDKRDAESKRAWTLSQSAMRTRQMRTFFSAFLAYPGCG